MLKPNMTIEEKVAIALKRIEDAVKKYDPMMVIGLYSGGHDSFSSCFVASLHSRCFGMLHINTGMGVEATREHVRETCKKRCWKLHEYKAEENTYANGDPNPKLYDEWVLKYGFPGPGQHGVLYINLKQRSLDRFERDCGASAMGKKKRRVLYVTGARSQESTRRMGNTDLVSDVRGRAIWLNPIHDWTKLDTTILIEHVRAKRNPVVDLIHKSGECLCGAFAQKGELAELALWPETRPAYERIVALQKKVWEAGFPWGWEDAPPKEYLEEKRGQIIMPELKQFLCWSCNAKRNTA